MIAVTLPPLALLACCLVSVTAAQAQTSVRDASSSLTSREEACYSTEAESLKPLGKKFVKNFLLDQKAQRCQVVAPVWYCDGRIDRYRSLDLATTS
jgi:hypothetical protein